MKVPQSLYLLEIVEYGITYLLSKGISNAKKEIEWLCRKKLNISDLFLIKKTKKINITKKNTLLDFITRRSKQEPFQYIIEEAPFYDQNFYVNHHVLIPRPETEIIIEILKKKTFKNALDIGTGSGNLAVIISLQKIAQNILAIDISKKALFVAHRNIQKFNISNIDLKCINFLKKNINKKFDLVVANPPYISSEDYHVLPEMIKKYEPKIALTDFNDGYNFYRYIADHFTCFMNADGIMLLEIGLENTKAYIEKLFHSRGCQTKWYKDYNGSNRILKIKS